MYAILSTQVQTDALVVRKRRSKSILGAQSEWSYEVRLLRGEEETATLDRRQRGSRPAYIFTHAPASICLRSASLLRA